MRLLRWQPPATTAICTGCLEFSAWSQAGGSDADLAGHLGGARRGVAPSVPPRCLACPTLRLRWRPAA
jgi:hypothetical protein